MRKEIKRYIYDRDGGRCFHCGKTLRHNQVSIDHYYPRSLGGSDEDFNLVLSCKTCNKYKKSTVPPDSDAVNLALLKRSWADKRIRTSIRKADMERIGAAIEAAESLQRTDGKTVFTGSKGRVTMKDNKVIDLTHTEV